MVPHIRYEIGELRHFLRQGGVLHGGFEAALFDSWRSGSPNVGQEESRRAIHIAPRHFVLDKAYFVLEKLGSDGYWGLDQNGDPRQFKPVQVLSHPVIRDGEVKRVFITEEGSGNTRDLCGDRSILPEHLINQPSVIRVEVPIFQPIPQRSSLHHPVVFPYDQLTARRF